MSLREPDIISLFNFSPGKLPRNLLMGIGDDAAAFKTDSKKHANPAWVITQDLLIEKVHFRLDWISAADLAYKAISVNLSDLAAMGASPRFLLLALAIPSRIPDAFLKSFARAFRRACAQENITLIGGDTCNSKGDLMINVTAIGIASQSPLSLKGRGSKTKNGPQKNTMIQKDGIIRRNTARRGDFLYVSGPLGASSLGLYALEHGQKSPLVKRHHRPPIRTQLGRDLGQTGFVTAMTDISDGLLLDAESLCEDAHSSKTLPKKTASLLSLEIDLDRIPMDSLTRREAKKLKVDPLPFALGGGEDYELLFTVAKSKQTLFEKWAKSRGHRLHLIGNVTLRTPKRGALQLSQNGKSVPLSRYKKGYTARNANWAEKLFENESETDQWY